MDNLISPTKAAQQLRLHVSTVYRWIHSGRLPAYRKGARIEVRPEDVKRMLVPIVPRTAQAMEAEARARYEQACENLRRAGIE